MEAKKLEILMTAVDLGSFSKASEVVGYTQSGLTHLVNSLERSVSISLLFGCQGLVCPEPSTIHLYVVISSRAIGPRALFALP